MKNLSFYKNHILLVFNILIYISFVNSMEETTENSVNCSKTEINLTLQTSTKNTSKLEAPEFMTDDQFRECLSDSEFSNYFFDDEYHDCLNDNEFKECYLALEFSNLNNLPSEIKVLIIQFLVNIKVNLDKPEKNITTFIKEVCRLGLISKEWKNIVSDEYVWKKIFLQFFRNNFKKLRGYNWGNPVASKPIAIINSIIKMRQEKKLNTEFTNAIQSGFDSIIEEVNLHFVLLGSIPVSSRYFVEIFHKENSQNIIKKDSFKFWPELLIQAIYTGYEQVAELIINSKVDINAKDKNGETPIVHALRRKKEETYYTENGITNELYHRTNKNNSYNKIIKLLIGAGSNVNVTDNEGEVLLITAIELNDVELARMLLDAGADVNQKGNYICSPLMLAIKNDNCEVVKMLVKAGAAKCEEELYFALVMAIHRNKEIEIVTILLSVNAGINHKIITPNRMKLDSISDEIKQVLSKYMTENKI